MLPSRFIRHPLLLHLPAALWIASFVMDVLAILERSPSFAAAAFYAMLGGLLLAGLALPAAIAEYFSIPTGTRPKRIATFHLSVNLAVTLVYLLNFFHREGQAPEGAPTFVAVGEAALSGAALLALAVSGSIGSRMAMRVSDARVARRDDDAGRGFRPAA